MSNVDNTGDKISTRSTFTEPSALLALLIVVAQVIVAIMSYPLLPAQVPSHWNAAGQIDGYLPKWANAVLFPAISLFLFFILRFVTQVGPRLGYQNQRTANREVVNLILVGVLLLMLVIQMLVTAIGLGIRIDVVFVISLAVSILMMFIGNYLGKLRRNFWAGIRTPWTLASDVVWERTHRLGGWLFVLAGLIGVITSFFPPVRLWGLMVPLLLSVVILVIYSYVAYQRYTVEGKEPLSPPFDSDNHL